MILRPHAEADAFLAVARPILEPREAEVALLLGVALRLATGHPVGDGLPYLATVSDEGRVVACAVRTPPYGLILDVDPPDDRPIETVVEDLAVRRTRLPGVHARTGVAERFAEAWCRRPGDRAEISRRLRSYVLTEVIPPPTGTPGRLRAAERSDRATLVDWAREFIEEAIPDEPRQDPVATVDRMLNERALFVWDNGGPVSMAATTRPMPKGASISVVYTPEDQRGQGYASACVAALSQRVLDSGKAYCTLYTDLANPTSNAIYQRIGYQPLADFLDVRFTPVSD
jgi:hypothetical protein